MAQSRCCRYMLFQKRAEYQAALALAVPQSRPDDQILRCCLQLQARMRQVFTHISSPLIVSVEPPETRASGMAPAAAMLQQQCMKGCHVNAALLRSQWVLWQPADEKSRVCSPCK